MIEVLLVDGVGNGVLYRRDREVFAIILRGRRFEKVAGEVKDGREVYRLAGVDGDAPIVRHINKYYTPTA